MKPTLKQLIENKKNKNVQPNHSKDFHQKTGNPRTPFKNHKQGRPRSK